MIRLGVFGGGFKPFTMGHFSMMALAESENDKAILLYGMSGRDTKGAEFNYTPEMAREIFEINKTAIEREMPNVTVVEAKPSPIAAVFGVIRAFKDTVQPPEPLPEMLPSSYALDAAGINPSDIGSLTIYDGPDDIARYMKYLDNPAQSQKYFGSLYDEGRLRFDMGPGREDRGVKGMEGVVRQWVRQGDEAELEDRIGIRGTRLRRQVAGGAALEEFRRFIPPIYTDEEAMAIFSIMRRGVPSSESMNENLRALIRAFVRG
jgi:hypothetical protein